MRRIDLLCLLAAPMASGFCMTYLSLKAATAALACWNIITWAPSVLLLCYAEESLPLSSSIPRGRLMLNEGGLDLDSVTPAAASAASGGDEAPTIPSRPCDCETCPRDCGPMCCRACSGPFENVLKSLRHHARTYWQQPVAFPAFSLAMLYFTVMSLGLIMTSYLKCAPRQRTAALGLPIRS